MDFSLIPSALSAISSSLTIARAALEVSDFNRAGAAISEVTQKLIDLQNQVIVGNGAFMQLQQEHASLTQRVREMEEEREDRARYSLFELSSGVVVYRLNLSPQPVGTDNPEGPEPMHYLCPGCFNKKAKSILQKSNLVGAVTIDCTACGAKYPTGEHRPYPVLKY